MQQRTLGGAPGVPAIVWIMAGLFAGIELVLQASDAGLLPWDDLRRVVYVQFAFFDIQFEYAMAGITPPPGFWLTPLSYALLHGDMLHMVLNTTIFLALGGVLARRLGALRFLALFALTAIAAAIVFGLIATTSAPMVGASGAIFGFFGALKRWEWRWIRVTGAPSDRFWGLIIALTIMNVALVFYFPGDGALAWEAHLGGFVAGWLLAPLLAPGAYGPSPI